MSKSKFLAVFATGAVLASQIGVATPAYAAMYYGTHIYTSSSLVSSPSHIDAKDSGNLTAFLPLYYVNQALAKFGITGTWDGNNWNLALPQGMNADMSNPQTGQQTNSGTLSMSINGQVVQYAPRQVAGDPANGGQATTYLPIWYIDQVIGRLAINATWDGTNWRMTKTTPETQQAMANAMWNVFGNVTWDVNAHPGITDVGISPSASSPVTASDVATYLADWAAKAKGVTASWGPNKGQWVPYSLQYEASSDPYTWADINGLFQGTSVTGPTSTVSQSDANTIIGNLQWWLTGDRVVNGAHHLHVPFYSNYGMWYGDTANSGAPTNNGISEANYQSYLADETKYYDEITATVNGTTINLTLPNTFNSASNMAWDVIDGQWEYGGWQAKDNRGGKTIQIPNSETAGPTINTATLNPNMYLEGFQVSFSNSNGSLMFFRPYDVSVGQYPTSK